MPARSRVAVAVALATILGAAVYLLSTVGLRAVTSSHVSRSSGSGSVPEFVYSPPETVPSTQDYGPVGPVSMVFAGNRVETGLFGKMERPWIAVSGQDGSYRALSAPHRPAPARGAMAVSADGRTLAWGFRDGVVTYDPVEDESVVLHPDLRPDPIVGRFSPDGRFLTVYDGRLHVLDVRSGEVAATVTGVDAKAARQAVWTSDGSALTYVDGGRLVIDAWRSDARVATPTTITPGAALAWSPSGRQLAALHESHGVRSVQLFDTLGEGRVRPGRSVSQDGYAIQDLIGYTGDNRVAVTAMTLESGPLPLVYTMSTVDTSPPTKVMQLSGDGRWTTLEVAAQPLSYGSSPFEEPDWPASNLSKLVASALLAFFLLGLYLTRRPKAKVRKRRRVPEDKRALAGRS